MSSPTGSLAVSAHTAGTVCIVSPDGVLDDSTYLPLRDFIIETALDGPAAVAVDVNALDVPVSSAWSVFTSARWHVSTWPGVPIAVVCADTDRRETIARNGVTRYVPAFATVAQAAGTLIGPRPVRMRVRAELPAALASLSRAREFVAEWLAEWAHTDLIPVATVVVNVFVENALQHTDSASVLSMESDGETIAILVRDGCSTPAARHEDPYRSGQQISGLAIVASVCRAWGSAPMPHGKTVWGVVGPENRL